MYKPLIALLLLPLWALTFFGQNKVSQTGVIRPAAGPGKSKLINPEGKTPFPYHHSVDHALLDRTGNIWFATTDGIYRYDGKLFTSYLVMDGFPVDHVSEMIEDKAGNIWFGAKGGIVRYGPVAMPGTGSSSFTAIKIQNRETTVTQIMQDRSGAIWFCAGYDVYLYDGSSHTAINTGVGGFLKSEKVQYHCAYPDDFGICGIYEDKQGNILISTSACSCGPNVTYRLDGSRTNHPCFLNRCSHNLLNLQEYMAHQKEIAASFMKIKREDGNTNIAFTTTLEDKSGNVWIGSDSGVYRYDGTSFIRFTKDDILSKSVVNIIYEDKKGNIWFGTAESAHFQGNGVFRYDPSASTVSPSITQFTSKDGLCNAGSFKNNIMSSITEDNAGKIWFSGNGGVCYYNSKAISTTQSQFTGLTKKDGLNDQPINFIIKDKSGNLWFGSWELGLYRYDGKSLVSFTENQPRL